MNRKFRKIEIVFGLFCLTLFSGCKTEYHDYYYEVQHSASVTGSILLTYSLNGVTETQYKWLEPDESFVICERKDVSGDGIWNIETSSTLYAVPLIVAANQDASKITEELSRRNCWPSQPEERNGNGVYTLKITDDLFVLERQEHYDYYIHNALDDSLFITSSLLGSSIRRKDTITGGQTINIGATEIYTYNEAFQGTDKYIEKKLSGISSLTLKYGEKSVNVNFKNYKPLHLQIEQQQCTLTADQSVFY